MLSKFSFPTEIHFGAGARWEAPALLKARGFRRPLLITDRNVATLDFFQEFMAELYHVGLSPAVFSEISPNPIRPEVVHGADAFHAHDADCIIAIGGGAALDLAKAVALLVRHPGDLFDYEDSPNATRTVDRDIPYWIALPTTAGTGSEVGRSTVISDEKTHVKKVIFSPRLLARAVFADPELTLGIPTSITAATGMDALTHCVEAYLARGYHPLCDAVALEGFRLAAENLPVVCDNPTDLNARSGMLMASMMGAIAFQKGLGVTHSCAHALSTVHRMHHGLANGVMIDHALEHNLKVAREAFDRLALAIPAEQKNFADVTLIEWLRDLKKRIGIPATLAKIKLPVSSIDKLTEIAIADGCHLSNPQPCQSEDFKRIFCQAFGSVAC